MLSKSITKSDTDLFHQKECIPQDTSFDYKTPIFNTDIEVKDSFTQPAYDPNFDFNNADYMLTKNKIQEDINSLNQRENWRGLSDESKKRKPTYLDACPEWDVVQSHKTIAIPILKNGSLCKNVCINKKYISIKETCAFDALVHLLIHACGKEKQYKEKLQAVEHPFVKLCINILNRGKINSEDYIARAQILKNINVC